jgi:hypothetical protein
MFPLINGTGSQKSLLTYLQLRPLALIKRSTEYKEQLNTIEVQKKERLKK